ncbi:2-aminoethylphosphonate--pyruvate transaminase [Roseomonas sp. BU-1]|uniref:2-aminoethylphosphonate--pyruvate transaminase n=2 Tax=Falsiroseomonas selenitidurans TaxID=2716335 RepID=A0ABX1DY95_9PROT|nr:2-aminoethylphosphonate--pyruvate transaminase [Falsiroseomonas selenitidurans]
MLLLIPGPVQTRPEVRACMAEDIAPWDEDFIAEYAAMRPRIVQIAGGLAGQHVSLPLPGCGHMVIEAAIRTFVPAGEKVLVVRNGGYAERLARLASAAGRVVVPLDGPDNVPMAPEILARALEQNPDCGHVAIVVSETGTGIINDPEVLGPVIAAAGRRMICDAVSGFGVVPFRMADHPECDVVVFTSNKCLEGLPGFGFAVAPIARLEACRGQAGSWALDLADVYDHALRSGWGSFRFTPAVQALRAFGKAMAIYEAEGGQPARLARYSRNRDVMYAGLQALGFTPYVAPEFQGPIIVNVYQPVDPNWNLATFQRGMKARGVILSDFSSTRKPSMRFGCIGAIGEEDIRFALKQAEAVLEAMRVGTRAAA